MNASIKILKEEELLKRARTVRLMEPLDQGDERTDTAQTEIYLKELIRRHYIELLQTLKEEELPQRELTSEVKSEKKGEGEYELSFPAGTVRVTILKMEGDVNFAEKIERGSKDEEGLKSPYTRGGAHRPVWVESGGGRIRVYGGKGERSGIVERAMGVTLPTDGEYPVTAIMEKELMKRIEEYD